MSEVKLRDPVVRTKTVSFEAKPGLWALACAGCGRKFIMRMHGEDLRSLMASRTVRPRNFDALVKAAHVGLVFYAGPNKTISHQVPCCSFECCQKIGNGGWRQIPDLAEIVSRGLSVKETTFKSVGETVYEEQLVHEWNEIEESKE